MITTKMIPKDWKKICLDLQDYHTIFYKMWEIGKPIFTTEIPTACVTFDKDGKHVNFLFNPDFWDSCSYYKKLFVICHESLHILFNHGYRFAESENTLLSNVAMDVAINHALLSRFGFSREKIEGWEEYCWIDTVFKDKTYNGLPISDDETSEFYYRLLLKDSTKKSSKKDGSNDGSGKKEDVSGQSYPKTVDHHDFDKNSSSNKIVKEISKSLSEEEKTEIGNMMSKHKKAGTSAGGLIDYIPETFIAKKKKWESIVKKWTSKLRYETEILSDQWARTHRRHVFLGKDLFLPSEQDVLDIKTENKRLSVMFFLDTSGSCYHLKERFFNAALSLDKKKFDVKLFCFDTRVQETTLESRKIYGGGGTSFCILENFILNQIKQNNSNYPDAVWVLTDGFGDHIHPLKPDVWNWFLTPNGCIDYIPKQSHVYNLDEFE